MLENTTFSLTGMGYLHEVIYKNDGMYARINVINRFNAVSNSTDDVWIDCAIKDDVLSQLLIALESDLQRQRTVIMQFEADYSHFECCHYAGIDQNPSNIILLTGNLRHIGEYFVNGVNQIKILSIRQFLAS